MRGPSPEVEERDLGGCWVEAYYLDLQTSRHMAIQAGLAPVRGQLVQADAHGLDGVPQAEQRLLARENEKHKGSVSEGLVFFVPCGSWDASPLLVRAVSGVLREMEPGWASAVDRARGSADDPDTAAFWSEVPIEAVLATRGRAGG